MEDRPDAITRLIDDLDGNPESRPGMLRLLYERAMTYMDRYNQTGAAEDLDQAIVVLSIMVDYTDSGDRSGPLSNLGNALLQRYLDRGDGADIDRAVDLHRAALAEAPDVDADRSALLMNLGVAKRVAFEARGGITDLDEAIGTLRQAVEITEPQSRQWILRLSNLGSALHARFEHLQENADLAEAANLLTEAVHSSEPGSSDGDAARANLIDVLQALANALNDKTKLRLALDLAEEVYLSRRARLGHDHADTLGSRNSLAGLLAQSGNYSDAERAYRALIEDAAQAYSPDHPTVFACRNNLANVLMKLGKPISAKSEFENLLASQVRVLGAHHPDTFATRRNLANVHVAMGDLAQAEQQYQQLLADQIQVYGDQHSVTTQTRASLSGTVEMLHQRTGSAGTDRILITIDIASDINPSVPNMLVMRDRLRLTVRTVFARSSVRWEDCVVWDAGDGLQLMVPPQSSLETLLDTVPQQLADELWETNSPQNDVDRVRLRMFVHSGPVTQVTQGFTGGAVIDMSRMLNSPVLREATSHVDADLVLTVSNQIFQRLVSGKNEFRRIKTEIVDKSNEFGPCWLRSVKFTEPAADEPTVAGLVGAVMAVPAIASRSIRRQLAEEFTVADELTCLPGDRVRDDVVQLVRRCVATGQMRTLVHRLRELESSAQPVHNLDETVRRLLPSLFEPSRPGRVLYVNDLTHRYGDDTFGHLALQGISLSVNAGEITCVIGPSGSGKSTLIRCIAGLITPTSGEIWVHGDLVSDVPTDLAIVFQDYSRSLFPWLTVLGNVEFPLRGRVSSRAQRKARAIEALERVGLANVRSKFPFQLSGGRQQRAAIARALAYQPSLLLMDEPFASVGAGIRAELEDLLLQIHNENQTTVLIVTHDIDESIYLGDRVLVLSRSPGSIIADLAIALPAQRDQINTRGSRTFVELRNEVARLLRGPDAPPASAFDDLPYRSSHEDVRPAELESLVRWR
jgi:NitT/TauT family transport system ATP-binding protein